MRQLSHFTVGTTTWSHGQALQNGTVNLVLSVAFGKDSDCIPSYWLSHRTTGTTGRSPLVIPLLVLVV
jgi:hypothetical protein